MISEFVVYTFLEKLPGLNVRAVTFFGGHIRFVAFLQKASVRILHLRSSRGFGREHARTEWVSGVGMVAFERRKLDVPRFMMVSYLPSSICYVPAD